MTANVAVRRVNREQGHFNVKATAANVTVATVALVSIDWCQQLMEVVRARRPDRLV